MIDIITSIPWYVLALILFAIVILIKNLFKNNIEIITDKISLKSVNSIMNIEKVIEIAYELSFIQTTKKMKSQMKFFEEKVDHILNDAINKYRKKLLSNLHFDEEKIFGLEDFEDMIVFKNSIEIVKNKFRDYAREFFRIEITLDLSDEDIEKKKSMFIEGLKNVRIETFNRYYRDHITGDNRQVSRSEVYDIFKDNEESIKLELLETFNNALYVLQLMEIERGVKIKELENFLTLKGKRK